MSNDVTTIRLRLAASRYMESGNPDFMEHATLLNGAADAMDELCKQIDGAVRVASGALAERDEMALRWSNCAMHNAIRLREIQLLAAAGLETVCVGLADNAEERVLFTSIHRLACEGQGTDDAEQTNGTSQREGS